MSQDTARGNKPDPKAEYADIIGLPHWEPNSRHPRMSAHDRAAQFSPFAALTGYDEMINEESRITDRQIELAEEQQGLLNKQLNRINEILTGGTRPELTITYFIPDPHKAGGRYDTVTAQVRRIDTIAEKLILLPKDNQDILETISFEHILSIQGYGIDSLDDSY